ncbi:MAG: ABC transporter ATP-binding protein [Fastidiosipila sp.]|jgi:branched-chain amino acid transport system ATP-binding protein|nr:ABC transporter ATP-binding protein [Fastidiosipila sp.]
MPLLEVKDLQVFYGGIHALRGVNIKVNEGEIVTIIGSNGAGKSTLLNALSGVVPYADGSIKYQGEDLPRQPDKIVKLGLSQVPEGRLVFANLTVRENLMMGAYQRRDKQKIKEDMETVFQLFPRLEERIGQLAGTLSGGEQQMLAMGRGLMSDPHLVMLDEPSLGLAPLLVETIFKIIDDIHDLGKTILLVEQNAYKALEVADYAYVLEQGVIVQEDEAAKIAADPQIQDAYLGVAKA